MKKWLPLIVTAVFVAWLIGKIPQHKDEGLAFREFGKLPIMSGGRKQPIDSLARNSLIQLRGKQTANYEPWKSWYQGPKIVPATEWLAEVLMNPVQADTRPVFRIDYPDLKGLLGLPMDKGFENDGKHFSWNQLQGKSNELLKAFQAAMEKKPVDQNSYEKAVINLWKATFLYLQLKACVQPPDARDWSKELGNFMENRAAGRAAAIARQAGRNHDEAALTSIMEDASWDPLESTCRHASLSIL